MAGGVALQTRSAAFDQRIHGAPSEPATPALWLARLCGALFVALSIIWTFQVPSRLGISVYKEQFLLLCLGLAGAIVFLTYPLRPPQDGDAAALSTGRWR